MTPGFALPLPAWRLALHHRVLVPLLFVLAGSAVSLAQAQSLGAGGPIGPRDSPVMAHHGMGPGMAGAPMMTDRMLDAAGASAEQKVRVHEILKRAHQDMAQQREGGRELRQQMMALLAAPQIDGAAAESLRQKMLARHDAASKRHLQALLDASAVLTAEQRQKLAERLKARHDLMERHQRERQALEPRH